MKVDMLKRNYVIGYTVSWIIMYVNSVVLFSAQNIKLILLWIQINIS